MKMKKIIAGMATMAMASTMFVSGVSAAAVVPMTASIVDDNVLIGNPSDDLMTDTITLSMDAFPNTLLSGDYINFVLKTAAGVNVDTSTIISSVTIKGATTTLSGTGTDGTFRATFDADPTTDSATGAIVLSSNTALDNATAYTIAFNTSKGDFGAAMFNTVTSNQVKVSAEVEPILVMDVQNTDIAFGTLTPDVAKQSRLASDLDTQADLAVIPANTNDTSGTNVFTGTALVSSGSLNTNTYVNVSTNAAEGYVVSVSNLGLKDPESGFAGSFATATINVSDAENTDSDPAAGNVLIMNGLTTVGTGSVNVGTGATNQDIANAIATEITDNVAGFTASTGTNVLTITSTTTGSTINGYTIDTSDLSAALNAADSTADTANLSATVFAGGQDYVNANEIPAVASTQSDANGNHNTENLNNSTGYGYGINAYNIYAGETYDNKSSAIPSIQPTGVDYTGIDNTKVGALKSIAQPLAFSQGPVSKQITGVKFFAKVSPLQEAGNYTDTVTFTVTGNF